MSNGGVSPTAGDRVCEDSWRPDCQCGVHQVRWTPGHGKGGGNQKGWPRMGRDLGTKNGKGRVLEERVILDGNSESIGGVFSTRNGPTLGTGCPGRGLIVVKELDRGVQIIGVQIIGLFLPRELDGWVFVELDVGSEGNADGSQIQEVLHTVVSSGSIGPYVTSPWGFKFRRLGTGEPVLQTWVTPPLQFLRNWPTSVSLSWAFKVLV